MTSLRDHARKLALAIPRVRRFYEYAQSLSAENDRLAAACKQLGEQNEALRSERAGLSQDLERVSRELAQALEEGEKVRAEQRAAQEKQEETELALYVLRSDYNRAVDLSERMRASLRASEAALEDLRREYGQLGERPASPFEPAAGSPRLRGSPADGSREPAAHETLAPARALSYPT